MVDTVRRSSSWSVVLIRVLIVGVGALAAVLHAGAGGTPSVAVAAEHKTTIREERIPIFDVSTGKVVLMDKVEKTDAEWKQQLTPEQYAVTRKKGTERPFSSTYHNNHAPGLYRCVCCGIDLYRSTTKFDSGTGWPSFWESVDPRNIRLVSDASFFMRRVEVLCARCGAHLGHVFDDGPPPTHQRHCINAVALQFVEQAHASDSHVPPASNR